MPLICSWLWVQRCRRKEMMQVSRDCVCINQQTLLKLPAHSRSQQQYMPLSSGVDIIKCDDPMDHELGGEIQYGLSVAE